MTVKYLLLRFRDGDPAWVVVAKFDDLEDAKHAVYEDAYSQFSNFRDNGWLRNRVLGAYRWTRTTADGALHYEIMAMQEDEA